MRGGFVTFEGGEGGGKSTQARKLAEGLRGRGFAVDLTREPGGTAGAEAIRELLVTGSPERWLPLGEALLNVAARYDHVERRIRPALAAGTWVVCDRFTDSTRVYQGVAGGLDADVVDRLHGLALGRLSPDLTLVLDLPAETGLARRGRAGGGGRHERMDAAFHDRVREGFLALAAAESDRCRVIDAARGFEDVARDVWAAVEARFARLGDARPRLADAPPRPGDPRPAP